MSQELLTTQRNAVFEAIRKADLDPASFTWETVKNANGVPISRIVHLGRVFFADFDLERLRFRCCPGLTKRDDEGSMPMLWEHQLSREVPSWLKRVKAEVGARDLWEELRRLPVLSSEVAAADANVPLSSDERVAVVTAIAGVRGQLAARKDLEPAELQRMTGLLESIAASTENATKGQISMLVWGAIASAIAAQLITVANGRWMLEELQAAVAWLPGVVRAMIEAASQ